MTRYQRVTAGLRGMLVWLDHELEQKPDDGNLLSAKAVTKDALQMLEMQYICLEALTDDDEEE